MTIVLAALLVASLVACNRDGGGDLDPEPGTTGKYTVTFDLNGAQIVGESVLSPLTDVAYDSTIEEPLGADGKPLKLQKTGYTFMGWTKDGAEFKFGKGGTPIRSNTTLRANFVANKYYHTPNIYATLSYDEEHDKFSINPSGHAKDPENPQVVEGSYLKNSAGEEVLDEKGEKIPVYDTNYSLGAAEFNKDQTTIYSTYNTTSPSYIVKPTYTPPQGEEDKKDPFCFWYYLDDNGRPVQFTEWANADDDSSTVKVKTVSYVFTKPLTLYAMFESDLPKVTVNYYDGEDQSHLVVDTQSYPLGAYISDKDMPAAPTKDYYEFDYWYFVYTTKDKDDNDVRNEEKFIFQTRDEDGKVTNTDSTSPMDAAHPDPEIIPAAEINFRPVTLNLYAKWIKKIMLSDAQEFIRVRNEISDLIGRLDDAETDETKASVKAELDSYLTAKIVVSNLDFTTIGGTDDMAPLFGNKDYPFLGTIDGGDYDAHTGAVKDSHTIRSNNNHLFLGSIFGYVNGAIKNLNVQTITIKAPDSADNILYLGVLASSLAGSADNCSLSSISFDLTGLGSKKVIIGGIAGEFRGGSESGKITSCSVTMENILVSAQGVVIGGVAGIAGSATSISDCTATLTITSATATGGDGATSGLRIGGLAGDSESAITNSTASLTITALEAHGSCYVGGIAGQNSASIYKSQATMTLCTSEAPASVGSEALIAKTVAIGGLAGLNSGYLRDSYATANLYVSVVRYNNSRVAVGGLVGDNYADRKDSSSGSHSDEQSIGAINYCYSVGEIELRVTGDDTSEALAIAPALYAGGLAGYSHHSNNSANFAVVDITITYNAAKTNKRLLHAGFLYGDMAADATLKSGYYASESTLEINGDSFPTTLPKTEEGEGSEEGQPEEEAYNVSRLGTATEKAKFMDESFVIGSESTLKWAADIWEIGEEKYPTFKSATAPTEPTE